MSLELIHLLVADMEAPNFLFIGSYRDNEIDVAHPLAVELEELRKEMAITNIHFSSITKENVNDLISDTV
eukprot:3154867-Ditylum_brightwellii.AAC.1